jgi:hypothetical protein
MDPIQVSYKQGYFHYDSGNVNVSFDREPLWIHVQFACHYHILQLNTGNQIYP